MGSADQPALTRTRQVYDAVASRYDQLIAPVERLLVGDGRRWGAGQARGQVLEIGTGTGRTLTELPADPAAVGVDISLGMLHQAGSRARDAGAVLLAADAARLPLTDASMDTVISTLTLCAMPDPAATLTETRRVLRPDGRLILLEHSTAGSPVLAALQRALERWTIPRYGEHLTREPAALAVAAGFTLEHTSSHRGGLVRRVIARPCTSE